MTPVRIIGADGNSFRALEWTANRTLTRDPVTLALLAILPLAEQRLALMSPDAQGRPRAEAAVALAIAVTMLPSPHRDAEISRLIDAHGLAVRRDAARLHAAWGGRS